MLKCWMLKSVCGGVGAVEAIDRQHSNLETIPDQVFRYAKTLEELHLDANQISVLPKDLFKLTKLRQLTLSDNEIKKLPANIGSLVSLIQFDISKNDLEEIPESIKFCKSLHSADFSNNAIGKLPEGFTLLSHLTHLSINDISLSELPYEIKNLQSLKRLEMRDNFLRVLPESIGELLCLEALDVGGNELEFLPLELGCVQCLKELYLDNNELQMIPSTMGRLRFLEYLDLSVNRLKDVPIDICQLSSLEDLCLSDNKLRSLPLKIGNLRNLISLKADVNFLVDLPDSIGHCANLQQLFLAVNLLASIPASIGLLLNLRSLHIDKNRLTDLPGEIVGCENLTVLSVRRNSLRVIPDNVGNLTNLRVLDLTGNQISHLPVSLNSIEGLRAVWLSTNQGSHCLPKFNIENIKVSCNDSPDVLESLSGTTNTDWEEEHSRRNGGILDGGGDHEGMQTVLTTFLLPQKPGDADSDFEPESDDEEKCCGSRCETPVMSAVCIIPPGTFYSSDTPPELAALGDSTRLMRREEEKDVEKETLRDSHSRSRGVMFAKEVTDLNSNSRRAAKAAQARTEAADNSDESGAGLRRHGTPHPRDLKLRHQEFLQRNSMLADEIEQEDEEDDMFVSHKNNPSIPTPQRSKIFDAKIVPPTFAPFNVHHSKTNSLGQLKSNSTVPPNLPGLKSSVATNPLTNPVSLDSEVSSRYNSNSSRFFTNNSPSGLANSSRSGSSSEFAAMNNPRPLQGHNKQYSDLTTNASMGPWTEISSGACGVGAGVSKIKDAVPLALKDDVDLIMTEEDITCEDRGNRLYHGGGGDDEDEDDGGYSECGEGNGNDVITSYSTEDSMGLNEGSLLGYQVSMGDKWDCGGHYECIRDPSSSLSLLSHPKSLPQSQSVASMGLGYEQQAAPVHQTQGIMDVVNDVSESLAPGVSQFGSNPGRRRSSLTSQNNSDKDLKFTSSTMNKASSPLSVSTHTKPARSGVSFAADLPEVQVAVETCQVSLHRLHPSESFGFSLAPLDPPGGIFVTKIAQDNPEAPALSLLSKNDRILKVNDLVISDGVLQHQQVVDILKASMDVTLTIERHVTTVTNQPESPPILTNLTNTSLNSFATDIKPIPVLKKTNPVSSNPTKGDKVRKAEKISAFGDVQNLDIHDDDEDEYEDSTSHYESVNPVPFPQIPEFEEISVSRNVTGGNWPFTLAAGIPFWAAWELTSSIDNFPAVYISSVPKNSFADSKNRNTGLIVGDQVLAIEGHDLSRPGVTLQDGLDVLVAHATVNSIKLLVKHPPPPPTGLMEVVLEPGNEKIGINIRGGKPDPRTSNGGGGSWNSIAVDTAVYISGVLPMQIAALDGRLRAGQRILSVNGVHMINKTHEEAVQTLRSRDQYGYLRITVCEGFSKGHGSEISSGAMQSLGFVKTQPDTGEDSNASSSCSEDENQRDNESLDSEDDVIQQGDQRHGFPGKNQRHTKSSSSDNSRIGRHTNLFNLS